jgi:hypothetical protein
MLNDDTQKQKGITVKATEKRTPMLCHVNPNPQSKAMRMRMQNAKQQKVSIYKTSFQNSHFQMHLRGY